MGKSLEELPLLTLRENCQERMYMSFLLLSPFTIFGRIHYHLDRVKRIWYLSPMRAVNQEEPSDSSESRGAFRQKARSLAPLNVWACAVKICHDGMLEDTNSLDGAHFIFVKAFHVTIKMLRI